MVTKDNVVHHDDHLIYDSDNESTTIGDDSEAESINSALGFDRRSAGTHDNVLEDSDDDGNQWWSSIRADSEDFN